MNFEFRQFESLKNRIHGRSAIWNNRTNSTNFKREVSSLRQRPGEQFGFHIPSHHNHFYQYIILTEDDKISICRPGLCSHPFPMDKTLSA